MITVPMEKQMDWILNNKLDADESNNFTQGGNNYF